MTAPVRCDKQRGSPVAPLDSPAARSRSSDSALRTNSGVQGGPVPPPPAAPVASAAERDRTRTRPFATGTQLIERDVRHADGARDSARLQSQVAFLPPPRKKNCSVSQTCLPAVRQLAMHPRSGSWLQFCQLAEHGGSSRRLTLSPAHGWAIERGGK